MGRFSKNAAAKEDGASEAGEPVAEEPSSVASEDGDETDPALKARPATKKGGGGCFGCFKKKGVRVRGAGHSAPIDPIAQANEVLMEEMQKHILLSADPRLGNFSQHRDMFADDDDRRMKFSAPKEPMPADWPDGWPWPPASIQQVRMPARRRLPCCRLLLPAAACGRLAWSKA